MSTAYHLQTDRQIEYLNQVLEQYLRCYIDYNLSNWSDLLPSAEFTYNNQVHNCYQALHLIFYVSKLTQYSKSIIYGQKATPSPPTLI